MEIPPGIAYLCFAAPSFLAPSVLIYVILRVAQQYLAITFSTWTVVLTIVFARPAYMAVMSVNSSLSVKRDLAARGAVLLPQVPDARWGLSTVFALVNSFKHGYPGDILQEWSEQLGTAYSMNVMGETRLHTSEPDHINGHILGSSLTSLLGTGILNSDGDMWKFHRTITRPYFSRDRISDFEIFHEHADDAINQAKERLAQNMPIDFQLSQGHGIPLHSRFSDHISLWPKCALYPFAHSSSMNHPSNVFADAFGTAQINTAVRNRYGLKWPLSLAEFWKDSVRPYRKIIDQYAEPILEEAFAQKNETKGAAKTGDDKDEGTLLDHLVRQTDDALLVKDELINLFVAGRDTTMATLTFAAYMLAEHPDVAQRLREEILNRLGTTKTPTYDDMREMKYLRAFVNEVLRLYPTVSFNSRTSINATVWPSKTPGVKPIYIPANTRCLYSVFLMHRREDLWGPDALEFDPDRFLDYRSQKYLVPNPFIFLPFNAGPRICLGQQFAYHEVSFFLVRLLHSFSKFSLAPDAQPEWSKPPTSWAGSKGLKGKDKICFGLHLTMYVKGGLWMRMEEAKEESKVAM